MLSLCMALWKWAVSVFTTALNLVFDARTAAAGAVLEASELLEAGQLTEEGMATVEAETSAAYNVAGITAAVMVGSAVLAVGILAYLLWRGFTSLRKHGKDGGGSSNMGQKVVIGLIVLDICVEVVIRYL